MKRLDKFYLKFIPPWLILLLGLGLTGLAGYWAWLDSERDAFRKFSFDCHEIRLKIAARLDAHQQVLLSGAAMFEASEDVTRDEWRSFVRRLLNDRLFNGIQGLGFALWIPSGQLAAHQATIRSEGFPDYKVFPEGPRDAYTAIIYLEPFSELNLRAFGYDMYAEPVRRAAMEKARDENIVSLSGKVTLIQEVGKEKQAGTLMYAPAYRKHQPTATLEQRRAALIGWVYSPFRMGNLLASLAPDQVPDAQGKTPAHVHLRVYDGAAALPDKLLYNSATSANNEPARLLATLELVSDFNGVPWLLQFERIAGSQGDNDVSKMWITLGAGSLISLLLFLLLRTYQNMRLQAVELAHHLNGQLSESEQRFPALADSAPIMIWQSGADKQCSYFNKMWLDFTGRSLAEELGNGWAEGVHPDDLQHCLDAYNNAFDQRRPFSVEYRLRRHDGEYRWLVDNGIPRFAGAEQRFLGYTGTCLDITERKHIEEKLAQAHRQLRQFTYIAAHHLQEPARRLVSFSQRLQKQMPAERLNEDALAALHFIEQSAKRQSTLVRDIQLYLAADQPRGAIEKQAVAPVIAALLKRKAALLGENGAEIDYNTLPQAVIDYPRLKDIFSILLDNALQYRHPARPPHIRISGALKAGRALYRFEDNGVGIPAEYRERVFGVFERLQVNDDQSSTGVGLAIVRRILESCGGEAVLQETPGGGLTVLFDLPG